MKRIISILLIVILLWGSCVAVAAEDTYKPGDVNGDSFIDAADALNILKYAVEGFPNLPGEVLPDKVRGANRCGPVPGEYQTIEDLLIAVRDKNMNIHVPDLLYIPILTVDRYKLDFVRYNDFEIYYQYFYTQKLSDEVVPVSYCVTIQPISNFSVAQRADELLDSGVVDSIFTFDFLNGQKAIMYQAGYEIVFMESIVDQNKIEISIQPNSTIIEEAVKANDRTAMRKNIYAYMEQQAKEDFERLFSQFQFKKCDAGVVIAGDVNGDGIINAVDALYVLQYAVGKREHFPAEDVSN